MENIQSIFQKKLNTLVREKLDERKKQLLEGPVACNCVSENGQDCGCTPKKHDGVAEAKHSRQTMIDFHTERMKNSKEPFTIWHQHQIEFHEKELSKEAFATDDGREVYKDSKDGAYDELHGEREGGPQAPDGYNKKMNIGKSDNVNDGFRAGSQKAFEVWKGMSKKEKAHIAESIVDEEFEDLDNAEYHVIDHHTQSVLKKYPGTKRHVARRFADKKNLEYGGHRYSAQPRFQHHPKPVQTEDTTAGVGMSGLGGMDSTDGMLFGQKANKTTVKDKSKKKVWSPPRQLSLAVLKPY